MYKILCLLTGGYVRYCSYESHIYNTYSGRLSTIELHTGIVLPTDSYRCKNVEIFPINFNSIHKLYWFIRQWFDNKTGFLGATNPESKTPFPCANPAEMFGLPFEAFEIHNTITNKPELTSIREIYNWRV